MKKYIHLFAFIFILSSSTVMNAQEAKIDKSELDFYNTDLSMDERIDDLISRLSLEEKAQQMLNASPAIERLGIPAYDWWNEALHGLGRSGVATVFPQAIGMGATFDKELILQVSTAISDEARANYNNAVKHGYHRKYSGLTFWTPNVNIFRDPRWGRGQETYGEDPYLTSKLGEAFVKGLQGDNDKYLKTAAAAKHYAVHSGPEKLRHEFNADVSEKDLWETYLPAFKTLVDANVETIMCAYNSTNGEPCCANNRLINDILRDEWGFNGHVVSDCWALQDFVSGHSVVDSPEAAAALALEVGVDLNCGDTYNFLARAVQDGLVSEKLVDKRLHKLLETRFKLGLFDPEDSNPYNKIGVEVMNSKEHRVLARETARKSIVLLKNDGVLPLKNNLSKYFITGPNATNIEVLLGNYHGVSTDMVTMLEGIAKAIEPESQLQYRMGTRLNIPNENPQDWASPNAGNSDATFVVMGISGLLEGEEGESIASPTFGDRMDYNLPQNQIDYLQKVSEAAEDRPVVAIVTGGSPMNLAEVHKLADAVLLVWYPGEEGGNAVADIIFGKNSPSGRLPITFPMNIEDLPAYEDYTMEGRTYKYMDIAPMYPFGYGLSYTDFEYSEIKLSKDKIKKKESVDARISVTNTGDFEADEVVQVYLKDVKASSRVPNFELVAFKNIHLKKGESKELTFEITPEMLSFIDDNGKEKLEKGTFEIYIGGSSPLKRNEELGKKALKKIQFQLK
ncbi:glycoside hydrolase family 3 N-terminal domain-containing protein [Zunongwangia sp.]|uniref:glycoside hydrolase family 3 N-terminal domain-containing protein n=1 Tax=Zunongwangia sp. TaxID=1965325 RepID=UPI003AA86B62